MGPLNRVIDLRRRIPVQSRNPLQRTPRRSPLKTRRRRLRAAVTAVISLCLLFSLYIVHTASYLPQFTFQRVSVHGVTTLSAAAIQLFIENKLDENNRGFISGRSIFTFNFAPLEQALLEFSLRIRSADISRDTSLGNGLTITIEERAPYAQWCERTSQERCFLIDERGVVFAPFSTEATSSFGATYIFFGALSTSSQKTASPPLGGVFAAGHFPGVLSLLRFLREEGFTPLTVRLEQDQDFLVTLQEGFYVKASFGQQAETIAKNLKLILTANALRGKQSKLEYVDLRFGNRVYYKLQGQTQQ